MEFNFKNIHMGDFIKKRVTELEISNEIICDFLNVDESFLLEIYSSKAINSDLLLNFCKFLEYDFFRIYSQHLVYYAPPANNNYKKTNNTNNIVPSFNKRLYTPEIIDFIVEIIENNEKSSADVIKDYRIPRTTLYKWLKKHKK